MAIPSDYRLLTSADIGKVFGVDLEPLVYFDTSVTPNNVSTVVPLTNFISIVVDFGELTGIVFNNNIKIYDSWDYSGWLSYTDYQFESNVEITSYNTDYEWNNWLYVKDIPTNPYNIKMTKPFITIECKDKKMTENLVIQAPESGGSTPKTFTLDIAYQDSGYYPAYYSIDGGAFVESGYIEGAKGNYVVAWFPNDMSCQYANITGASVVYNTDKSIAIITILEDNANITLYYE